MKTEFIRESRTFRGLPNEMITIEEKMVFLNLCAMYHEKGGQFYISNEEIGKSIGLNDEILGRIIFERIIEKGLVDCKWFGGKWRIKDIPNIYNYISVEEV